MWCQIYVQIHSYNFLSLIKFHSQHLNHQNMQVLWWTALKEWLTRLIAGCYILMILLLFVWKLLNSFFKTVFTTCFGDNFSRYMKIRFSTVPIWSQSSFVAKGWFQNVTIDKELVKKCYPNWTRNKLFDWQILNHIISNYSPLTWTNWWCCRHWCCTWCGSRWWCGCGNRWRCGH